MTVLALLLSDDNAVYDDMVVKFLEQFLLIMDALRASGAYDEADGFYYDRVVFPSGDVVPIKVPSLVGVIPALPAASIPGRQSATIARLQHAYARRLEEEGRADVRAQTWRVRDDPDGRRILVSVVSPDQFVRITTVLFDEEAFLSPYGLRAISRTLTTPYEVPGVPGARIEYEPAESRTAMYGGNSNWRGPVWFPVNYVVIRSLLLYDDFFGDDLLLEYPTGSGVRRRLREIADDLADRLVRIWLPDAAGRRPVYGGTERLQTDPAWKDNLFFFEYFHGDNGAGLGAAHQTGWTALVVDLLLDPPGRAMPLRPGLARD
jgi:hypothetical protein